MPPPPHQAPCSGTIRPMQARAPINFGTTYPRSRLGPSVQINALVHTSPPLYQWMTPQSLIMQPAPPCWLIPYGIPARTTQQNPHITGATQRDIQAHGGGRSAAFLEYIDTQPRQSTVLPALASSTPPGTRLPWPGTSDNPGPRASETPRCLRLRAQH